MTSGPGANPPLRTRMGKGAAARTLRSSENARASSLLFDPEATRPDFSAGSTPRSTGALLHPWRRAGQRPAIAVRRRTTCEGDIASTRTPILIDPSEKAIRRGAPRDPRHRDAVGAEWGRRRPTRVGRRGSKRRTSSELHRDRFRRSTDRRTVPHAIRGRRKVIYEAPQKGMRSCTGVRDDLSGKYAWPRLGARSSITSAVACRGRGSADPYNRAEKLLHERTRRKTGATRRSVT